MRPRNGHSAILVQNRFMLVFGGIYEVTKELDDLHVLDLSSQTWHEIQQGTVISSPRVKTHKKAETITDLKTI